MNGKSKCKILKQIRKEIARQNDIEYVTSECKFQGECTGTCPKCESEVRYLEQELSKRRAAGKTVAVVGIAASLLVGCASRLPEETKPSTETDEAVFQTENTDETGILGVMESTEPPEFAGVPLVEEFVELGEVPYEETEEPLMCEPLAPTEKIIDDVLTGDVAYVEDEWEN